MPIERSVEEARQAIDKRIAEIEAMQDYSHHLPLQMVVTNLHDIRKELEPTPELPSTIIEVITHDWLSEDAAITFRKALLTELKREGYRIVHESKLP